MTMNWMNYESVYECYAKLLQSCLTLYDPIDGSPPGSPIPGILQARILEWVAISFSSAWKRKVKVKSLGRVRLLATQWTAAHQAPPFMGFSRQEYWSGVPLPSPCLWIESYYFPSPFYKWSAHFYLFYFNINVTSSVYWSFPGHPISSRLFCPFAPFTKLGKLKILLHPFPWSLGSAPHLTPQNPDPAQCTPQDLLKQNSKDRILTFKEATTECELVIKPVTKEVGRCHEPKTQREG